MELLNFINENNGVLQLALLLVVVEMRVHVRSLISRVNKLEDTK